MPSRRSEVCHLSRTQGSMAATRSFHPSYNSDLWDWRCITRSTIRNHYSVMSECAWNMVYWPSAALTTTALKAFAQSDLGSRPCRRRGLNSWSPRRLSSALLLPEPGPNRAADERILRQDGTKVPGN